MSSWTDLDWLLIQDRLRELANIKPGWDGPDSPPISPSALSAAEALLDVVEAEGLSMPWLSPTGAGGVLVEWSRDGLTLELEAMPDSTVEYLYIDPDDTDHEGALTGVSDVRLITLIDAYLNRRVVDGVVLQ